MNSRFLFLLVLLLILFAYPATLLITSTGATLRWESPPKVIGVATPLRLHAANPHGIREISAYVLQGSARYPAFSRSEAPVRWRIRRTAVNPVILEFEAGAKRMPGLADGKARIVVEAVSNDLRARRDILTLDIEVNTKPPFVQVDQDLINLNLAGAGAIGFSVGGYWTEAGVRVGKYRFRSFPSPGGADPKRRVAIFALPHDTAEGDKPQVFASNPAGAEVVASVKVSIQRKKFRTRGLDLSDEFIDNVIRELDAGGTGTPVERFLRVNQTLRKANNEALHALRLKTDGRPLWSGAFLQLANSAVEAQFCDYRGYSYKGKVIDHQVHLGFDLASVKEAEVSAANDGIVVHAAPLGIYGNAIVIDHGLGVQSLYAHLSRMQVKAGEAVKKRQPIGRSGSTGLAGGDHLHFTMLVDGAPSNPLEWWDDAFLEKRILSRFRK